MSVTLYQLKTCNIPQDLNFSTPLWEPQISHKTYEYLSDTYHINSHTVKQNKCLPDEELLSCSHCTPSGKEFLPCSQCTPSGRTLLRQSSGARIPNKWKRRDWTQPTGRRRRECSILDNMAPAKDWCKIPAVQNTTSMYSNQKLIWLFIYYIKFYTLVILVVSIPRHSFRIAFMMNIKRKICI